MVGGGRITHPPVVACLADEITQACGWSLDRKICGVEFPNSPSSRIVDRLVCQEFVVSPDSTAVFRWAGTSAADGQITKAGSSPSKRGSTFSTTSVRSQSSPKSYPVEQPVLRAGCSTHYDFGDDWERTPVVERCCPACKMTFEPLRSVHRPHSWGPPENCGGIWGLMPGRPDDPRPGEFKKSTPHIFRSRLQARPYVISSARHATTGECVIPTPPTMTGRVFFFFGSGVVIEPRGRAG